MAGGLHLTVLTPEKAVLEQDVYSIVAPGAAGYLGIMKNHAPLITTLSAGKLTVKNTGGQASVYAIGGGFLEVSQNRITILADTLEPAEDIDVAQATEGRDWALRRLKQNPSGPERDEAETALARNNNRIRVKRNPSPSV